MRPNRWATPGEIDWRDDEEWIETLVSPHYLASTHGRVYSTMSARLVRPFLDRKRWKINLRAGGGQTAHSLPRLILTSFTGPPPGLWDKADPIDGDPANCRLDNLRWAPREMPVLSPEVRTRIGKAGYAASPIAQANRFPRVQPPG